MNGSSVNPGRTAGRRALLLGTAAALAATATRAWGPTATSAPP